MQNDCDENRKQKEMMKEMKKLKVVKKHEYKDKLLLESKQR